MNPLASAIFRMASEASVPAAKNITGKVAGASEQALKKIANEVSDWGWKGGKPGEITGQVFHELYGTSFPSGRLAADARLSDNARSTIQNTKMDLTTEQGLLNAADYQLKNLDLQLPAYTTRSGFLSKVMDDFGYMERADIPREWTGKLAKASKGNLTGMVSNRLGYGPGRVHPYFVAYDVSNAMRPMTNSQRETFLALLPEWSGTLEELTNAAKLL